MNTTSHRSFFGRVAAVVGVATLAVTLSGVTASAATLTQSTQPHRISFAAGTDHATVTGTFRPGSFDTWVLRAGAGQSMTVQMDPPGLAASVGVFAPDGSPLPGGPGDVVTYSLPATGDYRIEVGGGRGDTSPTYSMTVTIPPLAHNTTQRISFAAGADHATVHGHVPRSGERHLGGARRRRPVHDGAHRPARSRRQRRRVRARTARSCRAGPPTS